MDNILSEMYGKSVLCYIDDIVIYHNDFDEWVKLIDEVFFRLGKGGVYIEPKKCDFGATEIHLLGYILSPEGIKPNPKKVEAVKTAASPKNRKELMLFLGLVGFLRRFIPTYSDKTIHLSELLKKNVDFKWSESCEYEFRYLCEIVTDVVLLSVPSGQGPFIIVCDASEVAVGSALCQWTNKEIHVLEFASKKFGPAEKNWSTHEKEAYAIRWSVEKYQDYLKGSQTYVFTNHQSLQWMDSAASGKVQRLALFLQQFDLKVCAISGRDNGMADWLSRSAVEPDPTGDLEIEVISNPIYVLEEGEAANKFSMSISPYLPTQEQWKAASSSISSKEKVYLKLGEDDLWYSIRTGKLYVPLSLREAIMYWFHASRYGGHLGVNRTTKRIAQWFFWPGMNKDIVDYMNCCLLCKRVGVPGIRYLRQVLERAEPSQLVSLDYVGLREWVGCKFHYLVIIDHFSRFVITKVVTTLSVAETITIIKEMWIAYFGAPEVVLADRGTVFTSDLFQIFVCNELAASLVYSGAGYPQGNTLNEAVHRGIEASLTAHQQYNTFSHYIDVLRDASLTYNSTPHSATGVSPFYALFGKQMTLPGLQRFQQRLSEEKRHAHILNIQRQAMQQTILNADVGLRLYEPKKLAVGDTVVYYLQKHERKTEIYIDGRELGKYTPWWSTLVKIVEIHPTTIVVDLGMNQTTSIPQRLVRKLGADVPPSLQPLLISSLDKLPARLRQKPSWNEKDENAKRRKL